MPPQERKPINPDHRALFDAKITVYLTRYRGIEEVSPEKVETGRIAGYTRLFHDIFRASGEPTAELLADFRKAVNDEVLWCTRDTDSITYINKDGDAMYPPRTNILTAKQAETVILTYGLLDGNQQTIQQIAAYRGRPINRQTGIVYASREAPLLHQGLRNLELRLTSGPFGERHMRTQ